VKPQGVTVRVARPTRTDDDRRDCCSSVRTARARAPCTTRDSDPAIADCLVAQFDLHGHPVRPDRWGIGYRTRSPSPVKSPGPPRQYRRRRSLARLSACGTRVAGPDCPMRYSVAWFMVRFRQCHFAGLVGAPIPNASIFIVFGVICARPFGPSVVIATGTKTLYVVESSHIVRRTVGSSRCESR
jgi:hypothetical protein